MPLWRPRKPARALEAEAAAGVPGGVPRGDSSPQADPYVVQQLHVSPESRRVGAVGSVRPVDAPTPGPKSAPVRR
jgi:hypothetical protein